MKIYKNILFISAIYLSISLNANATSTHNAQNDNNIKKENSSINKKTKKSKSSWELGVGATAINWSRISLSKSVNTNGQYIFKLNHHHLIGGLSLLAAKEIKPWLYVDLQGSLCFNPKQFDVENKNTYLFMGGVGLQLRPTPFFKNKFVEPYVRVGANVVYKTFTTNMAGHFVAESDNEGTWGLANAWNNENKKLENKKVLFPVSIGVGMNSWITDNIGIGMQFDYMLSLQKMQPNFGQVSARIIYRFGGESKTPKPEIVKVCCTKPVAPAPVLIVEQPDNQNTIEKEEPIVNVEKCQEEITILLNNIYFSFNNEMYNKEAEGILDKIAKLILMYPNDHFLIIGFTDSVGSKTYNKYLSTQRAKNVYQALIQRGVSSFNLKFIGVGKGASIMPVKESNEVREGDRKVTINRVTNLQYWNKLK